VLPFRSYREDRAAMSVVVEQRPRHTSHAHFTQYLPAI